MVRFLASVGTLRNRLATLEKTIFDKRTRSLPSFFSK